jgi:hypothetical protein
MRGFLRLALAGLLVLAAGGLARADDALKAKLGVLRLAVQFQSRRGKTLQALALNDVVLQKWETGRMLDFETWIDGDKVFDRNRDVHEIVGLTVANFSGYPSLMKYAVIPAFGFVLVAGFYIVGGLFFHWLMRRGPLKMKYLVSPKELWAWAKEPDPFEEKLLANTSLLQYITFQFFAITVLLAMPVKLILRQVFTIKYVWVTPWFNV